MPYRVAIITGRRSQAFGAHVGEVVARGVPRPSLEVKPGLGPGWEYVVRETQRPEVRAAMLLPLDPPALERRQVELARERAEREFRLLDYASAARRPCTSTSPSACAGSRPTAIASRTSSGPGRTSTPRSGRAPE